MKVLYYENQLMPDTSFDAITLLGILIDFGLITILVIDWGITGAVTKAAQTDYALTPDCPKKAVSSDESSTACTKNLQTIQQF
jgi:hypothetical protein